MPLLLGCIADDFTGATDLANNLVRAGMRVVQTIGVPSGPLSAEVDAVVVALKSRTIAAAEAVAQSLDALRWLQAQGVHFDGMAQVARQGVAFVQNDFLKFQLKQQRDDEAKLTTQSIELGVFKEPGTPEEYRQRYDTIIEDLKSMDGWEEGLVTVTGCHRDALTGLVCGLF